MQTNSYQVVLLPLLILVSSCCFKGAYGIQCYNCASTEVECMTGNCTGVWCVEQIIFGEGRYFSSKTCFEDNLVSGQTDGCVRDQLNDIVSVTCSCQREDFCNDADKLRNFPELAGLPKLENKTKTNGTGIEEANSTAHPLAAIGDMYRTTTSTAELNLTTSFSTDGSHRSTSSTGQLQTTTGTSNQSSGGQLLCHYGASNEAEGESGRQTCHGHWCVYHTLQTPKNGFFVWMKGCADSNQLGIDEDSCENSSSRSFVQIYCACRSGDLCNRQEFFLRRGLLKGIYTVNQTTKRY